jgi:tetratricopeptide (TPR) repeat protein
LSCQALLPRQFQWGTQLRKCDFYSSNASLVETIRQEFREKRDNQSIEAAIDEGMELNKAISERVHLLYDDNEKLLEFSLPPSMTTFDEKYASDKAKLSEGKSKKLEQALQLVQSAGRLLGDENMTSADRSRLAKRYYEESVGVYPTADAYAYLGWHHYLDEELDEAIGHCERAMELDPSFGNPYNDLGLIYMQQGNDEEATKMFKKAKISPRNDVRHFPSLNLAAMYLEQNKVHAALHQYIEALHWMGPDKGVAIRNTIADMATFIVVLAEKNPQHTQ